MTDWLTVGGPQMTAGEFKFALCVESALNRIPEPEYRQLVVEMLMVLSLVVECHPEQTLGDVIDVDQLVGDGHQMYLHDQVSDPPSPLHDSPTDRGGEGGRW